MAFDKLKMVISNLVVHMADFKPFILQTDVSDVVLGAVLSRVTAASSLLLMPHEP